MLVAPGAAKIMGISNVPTPTRPVCDQLSLTANRIARMSRAPVDIWIDESPVRYRAWIRSSSPARGAGCIKIHSKPETETRWRERNSQWTTTSYDGIHDIR